MKKMTEGALVTAFDRKNIDMGRHGSDSLIAGAARSMYALTEKIYGGKRTLVLAGGGNNGADGLALALMLKARGERVSVLLRGNAKTEGNAWRRTKCAEVGIPSVSDIEGFDVYVDAVFGASFHPPLREDDKAFFDAINAMSGIKIACDVPSGFAFIADITVCFTFPKSEMYEPEARKACGRILFAEPGFTEEEKDELVADKFLLSYDDISVPALKPTDYKNTRGHLLIEGGSECYSGAPRLAAKSAFRNGAGLVTIKTEKDGYPGVVGYASAIVTAGSVNYDKYDAAVFGPGWGVNSSRNFLDFKKNMVIDASALSMMERGDKFAFRCIITPHMGEYRRLVEKLGVGNDIRVVAKELECIVVLKGPDTFITDGERIFVLDEMNPSLGVAGSGDVLSGCMGALLARGMEPIDAAVNGVLLHSLAGKKAHLAHGFFDSEELIDSFGGAR